MEWKYNVYNDIYHLILTGKKNIEVRLLNEKSEKILVGDYITFNNLGKEGEQIRVRVLNKNIYDNVSLLVEDNDIEKILPHCSAKELELLLIKIFGDVVKTSKLVAFQFEVVK